MQTLTFRLEAEDRRLLERLRGSRPLTRYVRELLMSAARAEERRREAEAELERLRVAGGVAPSVPSLPLTAEQAQRRAAVRAEREREQMMMHGAGIDRTLLGEESWLKRSPT